MKTWVVTVTHKSADPETIYFRGRPVITTGDGLTRLAAVDKEIWHRTDTIQGIHVTSIGEVRLLEVLDEKDYDVIMEQANELAKKDGDGKAIKEILENAIEFHHAVREVEDSLEPDLPVEN